MLPDVFADPRLAAVLVLAIAALVWYQRTLGWREYQFWHRLKVQVFPFIDRHTSWFVVSDKGWRDDPECLYRAGATVPEVFRAFVNAGGSPHLINSIKRRQRPDGTVEYSDAHLVWFHGGPGGSQTEAYLFQNPDGTTDVYVHFEPSVLDADDHLDGSQQRDGDPKQVIPSAVGSRGDSGHSEAANADA
jgi:hypothetical protein